MCAYAVRWSKAIPCKNRSCARKTDEEKYDILIAINDLSSGKNAFAPASLVSEITAINMSEVKDYLDVLSQEGAIELISDNIEFSARLKAKGRLLMRDSQMPSGSRTLIPSGIHESLSRFRKDHPDEAKTAFIIMRFAKTSSHEKIVETIRSALVSHGITGLRADDKQYHDELFSNILTYMHGCGFGIAVFERIESDDFNPNVSLELGYMIGINKPVCLLKDKTLRTLQTDLVGRLYRPFDTVDPGKSITTELGRWLTDMELV